MSKAKKKLVDLNLNLNTIAWEVAFALQHVPLPKGADDAETSAFYNGRERGFCLIVRREGDTFGKNALHIVWARNRNSDSVVVYAWEQKVGMNPPTNLPDKAWKEGQMFPADDDQVLQTTRHITSMVKAFCS